MTGLKKLEQWIRGELTGISPNLIMRCSEDEYQLFGNYRIVRLKTGVEVWRQNTLISDFSSTKTATAWCVADKFNKFDLANQLLETDHRLSHIKNDIKLRMNLAKRSNSAKFKDQVISKLESKFVNQKCLEKQLTECVNLAKYFQHRGFSNETARTIRNTAH
jgi:hypothetical protein